MKRRTMLFTAMVAGSVWALGVRAAPPEGRGQGHGGPHGNGGGSGKGANPGKGNAGQGNAGGSRRPMDDDSHGRHREYFDDRRDDQGRLRDGDAYAGLVYAGITAALARRYALDAGLGGYEALPPGIRKNLARGKPLPPGIAKKMVPGPLLGRLPRYDGYEWRVAGADLILISVATAVVADVLYDVFD